MSIKFGHRKFNFVEVPKIRVQATLLQKTANEGICVQKAQYARTGGYGVKCQPTSI